MARGAALPALALLAMSAPALAAGEPPAILATGAHAVVAGAPGDAEIARRVAALVDQDAPRLAALVGTDDLSPIPVLVSTDRREFIRQTGLPEQTRIVGLATLPAGIIHLDGTERLAAIERVVPHEVAHVMVGRALGAELPHLPLWVNEGVAEYSAGQRATQVDPVALKALGRGLSMRLVALDDAIAARGPDSALAYAQAASIVHFLVAERGEAVIAALLRSAGETRSFARSLEETVGLTEAELESAWRLSLARRWRWPLLAQSPVIWYGLMVLLFLAGLARYLRDRRRRQETVGDDW